MSVGGKVAGGQAFLPCVAEWLYPRSEVEDLTGAGSVLVSP